MGILGCIWGIVGLLLWLPFLAGGAYGGFLVAGGDQGGVVSLGAGLVGLVLAQLLHALIFGYDKSSILERLGME